MKLLKTGMALSLAAGMVIIPMAVKADVRDNVEDIIPISAPIDAHEEVTIPEYIEFRGNIKEIRVEEHSFSILVENDLKEGLDALVAYIDEDVILFNNKDMEFADKDTLEVGMEVSIFYHKETVMAMSYPPLLGPDVIVINESEEFLSASVSKFDKDFLNAEGSLIIHLSDDTVIVDKDGNKVEKEDLANKDLIIFYDIVLESYPGQTYPKKVIVMPEREDQVIIETPEEVKKVLLKDELIQTVDGVTMIPLRLVGETLGYEVTWNQETKTAELVRGPQWTAVTIGKDQYNFAKMLVKLDTAPALIESTTYVPLSFAEEILKANVEILEDGSVRILE